jgi:hypothetical protein
VAAGDRKALPPILGVRHPRLLLRT